MKIPAEDGSAIQSRMDVGARQTQQTTKTGKRNMGLFCFCALVLHTLSVVVGEVTIHDGPLSMTTTHPPDIGNITISPSIKGENLGCYVSYIYIYICYGQSVKMSGIS